MKLWSYWRSSSAYRVRIALGLKGLDFEYVPVHLVRDGGEQFQPDYAEVNPARQVPVLEVTEAGTTSRLTQSVAIIEYLEERYPAPALLPADRVGRARVRAMVELVNSGIQPHQNRAGLEELTRLGVPTEPWCRKFVSEGLLALEALAEPRAGAFLFGDEVTLADVYLIPQLYNARRFACDLTPLVTLRRAEENAQALEAFARARPEAQADRET